MLKADIALSDLAADPVWSHGGIAMGQSRIDPYPHPALETLLIRTDGQWFAVVRERMAGNDTREPVSIETVDAERFHQLYQACLLWPLDYVLIEVAQAGCRLRARAGVLGSAPIYCRATNERLTMSWDLADFLTAPSAIDVEIASHHLALQTFYSARQLFVGVFLLTERASFYVEPGKARYQYPAAVEAASPASSPVGDDALGRFEELLHRAITMRPVVASQIAAELSGGMDSATVASALTSMHGPVASLGILLDGDLGRSQIERRRKIAAGLGLLDDTVEIAAFPPTLDLRPGTRIEYPHPEFYLEAFEALWHSARARGCDMLFTGLGGDELFPAYPGETQRDNQADPGTVTAARNHAFQLLTPRAQNAARSLRAFDAPASPVTISGLLAGVCQAPHLLRHGLWPVNPLGAPDLVAFCHRLPKESRHGRAVMQRYLHRRLGEEVFPAGYVKETFAKVLSDLISRQAKAIAAQLRECALADLGLVDRRAALALLDEVSTTRTNAAMAPLANFLWLERLARQVAG